MTSKILRAFTLRVIAALALTVCVHTAAAQSADNILPAGIQLVLDGYKLPADSYSFLVQEINATQPLLAVNTAAALNPASTMKILTTLAALEVLGPAYTWNTSLYALGTLEAGTLTGDLLIKGGGDPFLVEEHFRNMLKALQRQGVQKITGDLIIDTSYFDATVSEQAIIDNQSSRTYNVLPDALMVNFQAVTFFFTPHVNGVDVVITTDPRLPNLHITNNLKLGSGGCTGFQRGIVFNEVESSPGDIVFSGTFPARCGRFQLPRAVLDPPTYAFGMFQQLWKELGGEFSGAVYLSQVPAGQQALLVWASPPLSEVIRSINKFSNNLMTRQLLLTLGAEKFGAPATVTKGIEAAQEYLSNHKINAQSLVLENGAGLSRAERISSALMVEILQRGYSTSLMPEFIASLPIGGVDGTMRNRLKESDARGNMHIKTGSLDEVSAIAGYVNARSGKVYAVSGMLNHELADRGPGTELMDEFLNWVYDQ